jgi:hypothetical protein
MQLHACHMPSTSRDIENKMTKISAFLIAGGGDTSNRQASPVIEPAYVMPSTAGMHQQRRTTTPPPSKFSPKMHLIMQQLTHIN